MSDLIQTTIEAHIALPIHPNPVELIGEREDGGKSL